MGGLEIVLLIVALALIIGSFFVVEKTKEEPKENTVPVPNIKQLNVISERAIKDMNANANKVLESTQDRLETISNDKIMAVNEYSDQVLAKIDANNKEVVFLYQMLQAKEQELKETVSRLESLRIDGEKKAFDAENKGSGSGKVYVEDRAPRKLDIGMEDFSFDDESPAPEKPEDTNIKNMKSKDRAKQRVSYVAKDEKQEMMKRAPERNEKTNEVINLYKKNKSVMEISKLLNMGQGEVKLIIELYCK
ncbi:MAG: hypothetical protein K6G24_07460 [Lachnospiraceae bacterium]|nr:hypothetical protein [Lachnospiraceae bacterium]